MICRDSFAELEGNLPHVGEAHVGTMSFSGAQMDPDRIAMGEAAKNISIIGVGGCCYVFGFMLMYTWIQHAMDQHSTVEVVKPPNSYMGMLANSKLFRHVG